MATATEKRFTPDDLLEITDRPPPDLVNGQLEERETAGQEASLVETFISALLVAFARSTGLGIVTSSSGGYRIFPADPNKVRFPDLSFIRADRLPGGKPFRGHCPVVPDLIVEVISPNESVYRLHQKIHDYRAAGVRMLWVVNPDTREVQVMRNDGTGVFLAEKDTLDGGDVLPGFSCTVKSFFE
jgi:Uma2 family endonuclease